MIKVEKLTKHYGSNRVLDSISLELKSGKVYGLVGENGAGKTTLFNCLAGIENYHGFITSDYKNLKDQLGFLVTEPFFFSQMTGEEYIQLLLHARGIKIERLSDFNLFDLPLRKYASTYSTGMKKKLAITAILLQKNEVFILDEPFNGIDIHSNLLVTEIIKRLSEAGKTLLLSSHIFTTLSECCDVIFRLEKGKIAEEVHKVDFPNLEAKMKEFSLGNQIEKFF